MGQPGERSLRPVKNKEKSFVKRVDQNFRSIFCWAVEDVNFLVKKRRVLICILNKTHPYF